ncbi:MAG: efflux RND transporter permease subunit [Burkholderiales bacterium]
MKGVNLSEWALRHQVLTLYLMAALLLAGVFAYFKLGRAEDPDFTVKVMVVRTLWPGATAAEVEQQVTDRIEKKLQETPWLDHVRSYSKPGESLIFVTLKDSTQPRHVPETWYQVRKKVADIRDLLPGGVHGPYFNDEFGDTFGTLYAFTSEGFTHAELKDVVDDVRQTLLRLPDVSKVELIGVQEEKIYIELSHKKLATLHVDPLFIFNTLRQQNAVVPSGSVETPSDRVHIRVTGDFESVENLREIGIRANGRLFRLGDIAHVYRGYVDPPTMKMRYRGEPAIGLAISMASGGNVLALGADLERTMAEVKARLPVGIEMHQVADQPQVVERSVNEFMRSLLEALVIVLGVSFVSLGLRAGMVVALSIPLVLAVTFLFMLIFGVALQRISLGALIIALGLLVDDAIISTEMMVIKMEQGWDRMRAASFAYTTAAFPMLTGTLVTAAGFIPVGFARSAAGEYTFSIFVVVVTALLVSWVAAVVFTPVIGFRILPDYVRTHAAHPEVYDTAFYRRLRQSVEWCLAHRRVVIAGTAGLFLAALVGFRFVEQQFFPSANRPELLVDLWLPGGASIRATQTEVERFDEVLGGDSDVVNFVSYVGGGSPRFYLPLDQQLNHDNFAQYVLVTRDNAARERVLARLNHALEEGFPMVRGRVQRLENGPPIGWPLQFRVSGPDPARVRALAERVAAVVRAYPAANNVHLDWNEPSKVVRLEVDQNKARVVGVSSQDLSTFVNAVLSGHSVTYFRERDKLIEVRARAQPDERLDLGNLKDINIHTQSGRSIPLSQVVTLRYDFEEPIIWRRNRLPTVTVRGDVVGAVQAPDVTARIDPLLDPIRAELTDDYHIEIGGAVEESRKGQKSVAAVVPIMVIVIVTLLMIQLQSVSRMLLVLLTAPLGLIGVTLFLLLFHVPFGFVAMLGAIALAGMIMRNSVILVDQIDQDIAAGHAPWQAVVGATVRRFRPIVLTAAAAILAMIPLAQSTFWGPMAIAIMGGLLVATFLTVYFVPALYAAWFSLPRAPEPSTAASV